MIPNSGKMRILINLHLILFNDTYARSCNKCYLQVKEVHHQIHFQCWQLMLERKKHLGSEIVQHMLLVVILYMKIHNLVPVDIAPMGC